MSAVVKKNTGGVSALPKPVWLLPFFVALFLVQAADGQTFIGALDDSRGYLDRWFYLLRRTDAGIFELSDSTSIFPNFINLRYHVEDDAVFWIFDEPGRKYPDSTITLLKIPVHNGHFQKATRVELRVGECPGISGCEFIVDGNGKFVLSCDKSGIEVELSTLTVQKR